MELASLRLCNFRNIPEASLGFVAGLNLITGGNGQGKSNLLEAVGLLATGRSFRRAPPGALRRYGEPWFSLNGLTRSQGVSHRLDFYGQENRQGARLDGKPMSATSALGQALAAVIYTPETSRLVRGGPGDRRAFMDWAIFSRERRHAAMMRDYQTALKARNKLLRKGNSDAREMSAWEDRLAENGARIAILRRAVLPPLKKHLMVFLAALTLDPERFDMVLSCQLDRLAERWDNSREAAAIYREKLAHHRDVDRRAGSTAIGPHRDDLQFRLDGHPLSRFGSQGQQKRFVLALKLAEAALLEETLGEAPLFLLDDPASELDRTGIEMLMTLLGERDHQLFVTSCDPGEIPWNGREKRTFQVTNGDFQTGTATEV
ncbi:MAG: DNA replication and repair protein RecF, partial [Magnetococcales bacterium]|nr:DNA replication and repair protein RecF [Magnetococcales bacterium]